MPSSVPPAMSGEEDEAGSQGRISVIDEILDQYKINWEPEYRLKFKKELMGFTLGVGISKPHQASTRMRLTIKPAQCDEGLRLGRFVQKVLVLPQQRFTALYSSKLSLGFLRCQFVAGYFWDSRRPSLDYRLSTKWNEGLRFKRKEYYQPTNNLLMRGRWHLDMQLPDVEGHLGGCEGSTQVPVDVEYGSFDLSITQLDWVCDLDGFKKNKKVEPQKGLLPAEAQPLESTASSSSGGGAGQAQSGVGPVVPGRISWPWQNRGEGIRAAGGGGTTG